VPCSILVDESNYVRHGISDTTECRRHVGVSGAYGAHGRANRSVLGDAEVVGGLVEPRPLVVDVDHLDDERLRS